jgi:hypothetical protein
MYVDEKRYRLTLGVSHHHGGLGEEMKAFDPHIMEEGGILYSLRSLA